MWATRLRSSKTVKSVIGLQLFSLETWRCPVSHFALIFPAVGFVLGGAVFLPVGITIGRNVGSENIKWFDTIEWLLLVSVVLWALVAVFPGILVSFHGLVLNKPMTR